MKDFVVVLAYENRANGEINISVQTTFWRATDEKEAIAKAITQSPSPIKDLRDATADPVPSGMSTLNHGSDIQWDDHFLSFKMEAIAKAPVLKEDLILLCEKHGYTQLLNVLKAISSPSQ